MGLKKQSFWPGINCSQMNSVTVRQKLAVILVNKVVLKSKSAKNAFSKKGAPKFYLERFG